MEHIALGAAFAAGAAMYAAVSGLVRLYAAHRAMRRILREEDWHE